MSPLTHFNLHSSRYLTAGLLAIHIGAVFCLLLSQAPWWVKIVGFILCSYSARHTLRRYALLTHSQAVIGCVLAADGRWYLQYQNGREQLARLQGNSWRSRHLLLLNFRHELPGIQSIRWLKKRSTSLVICIDALSEQTFRQLQAHLTLLNVNSFASN